MFESTPTYPDPGRYWRIVDDLGVNIFYTAPTALRALAQGGDEWVKRYRRDSLRVLGTRGRAHQPRDLALVPRRGGGRAAARSWTPGGRPRPGASSSRRCPGSRPRSRARRRCPSSGSSRWSLDPADGKVLEGNGVSGALCLGDAVARAGADGVGRPPPLQGDLLHPVSRATTSPATACGATRTATTGSPGRIDDVLNVSGHRLGTAEIESALVAHESVAEAAVVGFPHPIKGQGIYAYVLVSSRLRLGRPRPAPGGAQGAGAPHDRRLRRAGRHPHRLGAAEDAQRQDHAAHPAQDRRLRVRRAGGPHAPWPSRRSWTGSSRSTRPA